MSVDFKWVLYFLLHAYTRCIIMGWVFSLPNSCICFHLVAKLFTFQITLLIEKLVNIGNVSSYCNCHDIFIHIPLTFVAYQACSTTSVEREQDMIERQ